MITVPAVVLMHDGAIPSAGTVLVSDFNVHFNVTLS